MTQKYIAGMKKILDEGHMIKNERTGKGCLTIIGLDQEYNVGKGEYPMVTTRKAPFKLAIAELLGYIRGVRNAQEFADLGTKSWFGNANDNTAWLANPHRKGENDVGKIYGAMAKNWPATGGKTIDLIRKVYTNLKNGIDDRGEIITFWNPGEFDQGCLRPCLYEHIFSILDGTLYLHSTQRSNDFCLGNVANMQQCYVLLALMAQITGLKPGIAYHRSINTHIYSDQLEGAKEQVKREPLPAPTLWINPEIKTLEDIETWVTVDDFKLIDYKHHDPINYPFSV